jgi:putative ABC transport system permease protein
LASVWETRSYGTFRANISTLDLTLVQESLERLLSRVVLAIRATALFTLATGALVLVAALATSRFQRVREGALLRTLGATRGQVLRVAIAEYAALGTLAAAAAVVLALPAAWLLAHLLFQIPFVVPLLGLGLVSAGVVLMTTVVGLANSYEVIAHSPLQVLRME